MYANMKVIMLRYMRSQIGIVCSLALEHNNTLPISKHLKIVRFRHGAQMCNYSSESKFVYVFFYRLKVLEFWQIRLLKEKTFMTQNFL